MRHALFRCSAWLIALLIVFCSAAPAGVVWAQEDVGDYVSGEVLVKLNQTGDLNALLAEHNLTLSDQFGTRPIYLLNIGDGVAPPDKATALQSDSRIAAAEPNFIGQTPEGDAKTPWAKGGTANDYAAQWAPAKIRLPEAHARTRGRNVTVAVLDTGIDRAHPVFENTPVLPGFDFVDFDGVPDEVGSPEQHIVYGHGTHVAGLVALAAPQARLMPVRVLDEDGVGNIWVLIEGLQYAINNGADVINLSFSFARESTILTEIVAEITVDGACGDDDDDDDDGSDRDSDDDDGDDRDDDDDDCDDDDDNSSAADCDPTGFCVRPGGVVIVAAAGNRGSITPEYPAAEGISELLAVAASTEADTLAAFSNRGAWVDLAAPGERILSSVPGGEYGTWSGTSMAAPLVAGVAALVRARNSSLTAAQVAGRIVRAAALVCGQDAPRLDAAAAVAGRIARPGACVVGVPPE